MFLLLLACFAWTASVLVAVVAAWANRWAAARRFRLKSAELLVVGAGATQQQHAVDVTQEMLAMSCGHRLDVLPRLMRSALRGDVRDALARCHRLAERQASRHVRRLPMCYLDVSYSVDTRGWWQVPAPTSAPVPAYRCLYPIYSFNDFIVYPPRCPAKPRGHRQLVSATLTLRQPHAVTTATRQLSCQVTDTIAQLAGPCGDFHRHDHPGYQLRKHILQAVLRPDIKMLTRLLLDEETEAAACNHGLGPGLPADGSRSTDSLKSLSRPSMTVRFQIRLANNKVEVLNLD